MKALLHVSRPLGQVLMGFAGAFLVPIAVSLATHDTQAPHFAVAAALDLGVGAVLYWLGRSTGRELRPRDGFVLVAPAFILMATFAALPMLLALPGLSPTGAFFEAMSNLTTTGATVLTGLDRLPPSVNLWRHQLGWIGGFSVLGLAMAVLPVPGLARVQIYRLQSGPQLQDLRQAAMARQAMRSLWLIYVVLTLLCMLALKLAGMDWFDAVCHALSTLSLSGTSTHDASVAWFHSPLIESVLALFMLIGGINFLTHLSAWRERSGAAYRRDPEVLPYLLLVAASAVLLALYLAATGTYPGLLAAFRYAGFNTISMATTTGFASSAFDRWPAAAALWLLLLACVACCSGSAGGGIRMLRSLILFRQTAREFDVLVHPQAVRALKVGGRVVSDRTAQSVLAFIHLYTLSAVVLVFLLLLGGVDLVTALSAVLSCLTNTAHGLGGVGPGHTYGHFDDFQLWVCTATMLLGRLELFALLVPMTPAFWRQ